MFGFSLELNDSNSLLCSHCHGTENERLLFTNDCAQKTRFKNETSFENSFDEIEACKFSNFLEHNEMKPFEFFDRNLFSLLISIDYDNQKN